MSINQRGFDYAKERYAALGVNVERAMEALDRIPISVHCWQGDDVLGFEGEERASLRRASKLMAERINALMGWEEAGDGAADR